ncbi:unnamed protein product, partial [Symbiodinium pilosum]
DWEWPFQGPMELRVACLPLESRLTWKGIVQQSKPDVAPLRLQGSFTTGVMKAQGSARITLPAWTTNLYLKGGVEADACYDALEKIYGWKVMALPPNGTRRNCGAVRWSSPEMANSPELEGLVLAPLCSSCISHQALTLFTEVNAGQSGGAGLLPRIKELRAEPSVPEKELKRALRLVEAGPAPCVDTEEEEAAARTARSEAQAAGHTFLRVDTPSVFYREVSMEASRLREGTEKVFATLECAITRWGSRRAVTIEISATGELKDYWTVILTA